MYMERQIVSKFLKKYGMDHESLDIIQGCSAFMEDMEKGLDGIKSSLKMIPTYIATYKEIPVKERVIVVDAGGTNFRVAVAHFDEKRSPVIEDYSLYTMPGVNGEISKEDFYKTVAGYISPVLDKSDKISFCFSYAAEILPNKDGILMQLSKQVKVKGLVGDAIGENLLKTMGEMGLKRDKRIILLNDTVATLLGGMASYPDRIFDSYIGFILGTGTNTSYIEENRNIKKAGLSAKDSSMIINVESGGFKNIPRGVMDLEFDRETVDPGEYVFEKMMSGRYQGPLITTVIKKAIKDGLFSEGFADEFNKIKEVTLLEINEFLYYPYSDNKLSKCCSNQMPDDRTDDHMILYYLIDSIVERAAKLAAINLASILIKTGKGKNPCKPVCITADGSTFYKSKLFRNKLDYYVKKYMNDEKGLYCEFIKVENVTLVGTLIAGLLN